NQNVGIRIRGNASRRYASKSLTVYARPEYGDSDLSYKFFDDLEDNNFQRITLSNSGNDFPFTLFKDAAAHEISRPLHVENENYQPVITFINGEYWGILNIRERYDNEYFERVYNIEDVDLLEDHGVAEEGDAQHYQELIEFVENNSLESNNNYQYVKALLDAESFIDYYIANIYLDNIDWPMNNVVFWRKKTTTYTPNAPYGHDGRWRWALHDMDKTFAVDSNDFSHNNLAAAINTTFAFENHEWSTLLFRKLMENATFRKCFINRFADMMNTAFLPSRTTAIINEMKMQIEPEITRHIERFKSPASLEVWNNSINSMIAFANARTPYQRNHVRQQFGFDGEIHATVKVSSPLHGYIKINTIDIQPQTIGISETPYPWTGVYFKNHPIEIKAVASPGYRFSHWSGYTNGLNSDILVSSTIDFELTAHFVPLNSSELTSVSIHPNPTSGIVNIAGLTNKATYNLYTIDGRLIRFGEAANGPTVSLEGFEAGLYLLELSSVNGLKRIKIIKEN
ncbi:MAG TPA: CotH kinase family protein, partial [Flavobacterium sp.]